MQNQDFKAGKVELSCCVIVVRVLIFNKEVKNLTGSAQRFLLPVDPTKVGSLPKLKQKSLELTGWHLFQD